MIPKERARILIIDDSPFIHDTLREILEPEGYDLRSAFDGESAQQLIRQSRFPVVFCDLMLPKMSGLEALRSIKAACPETEVIMITGHGTVDSAVAAMKEGAYDFIQKPLKFKEIQAVVEKALDKSRLRAIAAIYESGQAVFKSLSLDQLLPITVHLAAEALEADDASIMLLNSRNELEVAAVHGLVDDKRWKARVTLGERVAGKVIQTRTPLLLSGPLQDDPRFEKIAGLRMIRSAIIYPLLIKGVPIGVLNVNRTSRAEPFTSAELPRASILCGQISQAIQNARLYDQLKEEKTKLLSVFAELEEAVLVIGPENQVLLANEEARRSFPPSDKSLSLASYLEGMSLNPPLAAVLGSAEPLVRFEAAREKPKKRIFSGRASRIKLEALGMGTESSGRLIVLRDITRERQEEQIKHSFIGVISHKLKTPLASINGYSELILEAKKNLDPKALEQPIQSILNKGRELSELVEKLVDFIAVEELDWTGVKPKPVASDELINETVGDMKPWLAEKKAKVEIRKLCGETINVDPGFIRRSIANLIENAVKFDAKREKPVTIASRLVDDRVEIEIADQGPGIPPEDLANVLTGFFQSEGSFTGQIAGWGLGLTYVKRVAEHHGGSLRIDSRLGRGTCAVISLPKYQRAAKGAKNA